MPSVHTQVRSTEAAETDTSTSYSCERGVHVALRKGLLRDAFLSGDSLPATRELRVLGEGGLFLRRRGGREGNSP